MTRRRLLAAGAFLVLIVGVVAFFVSQATQSSDSKNAHTTATTTVQSGLLPPENAAVLEKLGSALEAERLQALVPMLRQSEELKAALRLAHVKVQVLPETFRVYDSYATVDAQLNGSASQRVSYILQPSDGQWRIVTLRK